jgi:hypothetical protein
MNQINFKCFNCNKTLLLQEHQGTEHCLCYFGYDLYDDFLWIEFYIQKHGDLFIMCYKIYKEYTKINIYNYDVKDIILNSRQNNISNSLENNFEYFYNYSLKYLDNLIFV